MMRGPQAILYARLITRLHASGHTVSEPNWIDFPTSEHTRDTVTNLGRIAARTSAAVRSVLARAGAFALVRAVACRVMGLAAYDPAGDRLTRGVPWHRDGACPCR